MRNNVKFLREQLQILRIFLFITVTSYAKIMFVLESEQIILSYILFIHGFRQQIPKK